MKSKKILIISSYFPPHGGGGVVRIHNFVKYLPNFGFQPFVLTLKEKYYEKTYSSPELLKEYPKGVRIERTNSLEPVARTMKEKVYGVKKKNFLDKILFYFLKNTVNKLFIPDRGVLWIPFAVFRGLKIIKKEKIDIILSTSPPFSSNCIPYLLHKITGTPYVLDYRDDWIGNSFYSNKSLFGRVKSRLERFIEYRLIKNSAKVLSATQESISQFENKYPKIVNKYLYLPNGFDPQYFQGNGKDVKEEGGGKKIRFTYTGSLTIKRTPEYFFKALKKLIDSKEDFIDKVEVSFIGFIHQSHKELIESIGLNSCVSIQDSMSPKRISEFLQDETDVCLIFQRMNEGGNTAIPGKLYEYLAVKKPILCMDEDGATTQFLQRINSKLNAAYEDVELIEMFIKKLLINYPENKKQSNWDEGLLKQFNRKEHARILSKVLKDLLDQKCSFSSLER